MAQYFYVCNSCDWPFEGRDAESDAWADGVEHYNNHQHEGGEVRQFDGHGHTDADVAAAEHHHHHEHRHHEHHGHHEEPHIF